MDWIALARVLGGVGALSLGLILILIWVVAIETWGFIAFILPLIVLIGIWFVQSNYEYIKRQHERNDRDGRGKD
jgi:hypothetical protein